MVVVWEAGGGVKGWVLTADGHFFGNSHFEFNRSDERNSYLIGVTS